MKVSNKQRQIVNKNEILIALRTFTSVRIQPNNLYKSCSGVIHVLIGFGVSLAIDCLLAVLLQLLQLLGIRGARARLLLQLRHLGPQHLGLCGEGVDLAMH